MSELFGDFVKAVSDRTAWPALVACTRKSGPFAGYCHSHADCRSAYWEQADAEAKRLELRGSPPRSKSRKRQRVWA